MPYKAIIFDLDGTLVNSLEDISDAMNKVLLDCNYPTHSYETYQYFIGSGLHNLVSKALPENHKSEIEPCFEKMVAYYSENCTIKTKPYLGIIELIAKLNERGIPLAVLSNKADVLTKKIVTGIFPNQFDMAVGLKMEATKKPNPFEALQIAKKWNLNPAEILFVGDSDIDMFTATNAKMHAIGVTWGYRTEEELIKSGAKLIINQPLELLTLIQRQ